MFAARSSLFRRRYTGSVVTVQCTVKLSADSGGATPAAAAGLVSTARAASSAMPARIGLLGRVPTVPVPVIIPSKVSQRAEVFSVLFARVACRVRATWARPERLCGLGGVYERPADLHIELSGGGRARSEKDTACAHAS